MEEFFLSDLLTDPFVNFNAKGSKIEYLIAKSVKWIKLERLRFVEGDSKVKEKASSYFLLKSLFSLKNIFYCSDI